ncbi:MAG TPA: thioredoxin [Marinilabiliales bacterium]|nr:MAG: thiol reductase thioredoxin [Bacteroidetes bacterium GWC2_40_13]OFX72994.1 MAG: thiol reductase thioredoxin [Bacteroidetes bacterium GWD2_40_43]OFX92624.1 MAG: thiol reductase thioredoxin [Bacteroidetes bacterium GWE2_40_63]OFY17481.1 MAG: thiol reductase thioredoxin [Bacteroidetes bacterium GWF2_40_13]OFZ27586.1 MAG: thiol reductase thioredoxin [Bacteroidetes bacterium RIFOXYC2_FULL_40_12]HAM97238.1 thioredoxin [Marinilabiliales bacterium]
MKTTDSLEHFNQLVAQSQGLLAYFSHERCNVCKTLKPKLSEEFQKQFPLMEQVYVDVEKIPDLAAQYSVFTVPVILIFFEGRETFRKARNVGVDELLNLVNRPYQLLFD